MKLLLVGIFLVMTISVDWLTNFETAKDIAAKENKSILLNFSGSDWCGPCIKMEKEVFENETFLSIAEKQLVLVRADFPRSKKHQLSKEQISSNEAIAEKYNRSGKFPLTLLLDQDGKVIKEWDGYVYSSQDKFLTDLDKALSTN
jgi:thioredoxin-related protein